MSSLLLGRMSVPLRRARALLPAIEIPHRRLITLAADGGLIEPECQMDHPKSATPYVAGALVIALIAGVSGWAMRTRAPANPDPVRVDATTAAQVADGTPATQTNSPVSPAASFPGQDVAAVMASNEDATSKLIAAGEQILRSRYGSERVDAAWASSKQQTLERLSISPQIEQVNAQPLAIEAHCRTSVCLIEADFATRLAAADWHTLYTLNAGMEMFNSSTQSTVNPDGSVHLQIYGLARQ